MRKQQIVYREARDYLNRVKEADRKVEILKNREESLRMLATDTSAHLTGMPSGGRKDAQKISSILSEIDRLERKIQTAEEKALEIRTEVILTVCRIRNPSARSTVMRHFLQGETWTDIARSMNYSRSRIWQLRDIGLKDLTEILHQE